MKGAQQGEALGLGRHRGPTVHMAIARGLPRMSLRWPAQRWGKLLLVAHTCICTASRASIQHKAISRLRAHKDQSEWQAVW